MKVLHEKEVYTCNLLSERLIGNKNLADYLVFIKSKDEKHGETVKIGELKSINT